MTERMKLTEDDFDTRYVKSFEWTADDKLRRFRITKHDGTVKEILFSQILDDQEKAQSYDIKVKGMVSVIKNEMRLEHENKQLKEDKKILSETLVEEVELGGKQRQEIDNLKQKLEKIEEFRQVIDKGRDNNEKYHTDTYYKRAIDTILLELKEILESKQPYENLQSVAYGYEPKESKE